MAQPNGSQSPNGPTTGRYEGQLMRFCHANGLRAPAIQILSDRRGGRTAWSASATVQGQCHLARFWYDGHHVPGAREDAAQVALEELGQIPRSGVPPAQQLQRGNGNGNGHLQRPIRG